MHPHFVPHDSQLMRELVLEISRRVNDDNASPSNAALYHVYAAQLKGAVVSRIEQVLT